MSAQIGNKSGERFKTPEQRAELLSKLLEHLREGYHQDTFSLCDWDTVERYVKEYPDEFPSEKIGEAKREGFHKLEKFGHLGMLGKIENFNPPTWIFTMKNKLHWTDRQDLTSGDRQVVGPVIYTPKKNEE